MSWSASGKAIVDFRHVAVVITTQTLQIGYGEAESKHALDSAKDSIRGILNGNFSSPMGFGLFSVQINGHSNPGHVQSESYASDYIQIMISKEK